MRRASDTSDDFIMLYGQNYTSALLIQALLFHNYIFAVTDSMFLTVVTSS